VAPGDELGGNGGRAADGVDVGGRFGASSGR
jgi:hypothetical protein